MSGCCLNIKIGEAARPSTYKKPVRVPEPTCHEESWTIKSKVPDPEWFTLESSVNLANATASAWMARPGNKMQLKSFQKQFDSDGDGVIDQSEFKNLLKAAGSGNDSDALFAAMDADGDGVLTEAEIKALGQDQDGRARKD